LPAYEPRLLPLGPASGYLYPSLPPLKGEETEWRPHKSLKSHNIRANPGARPISSSAPRRRLGRFPAFASHSCSPPVRVIRFASTVSAKRLAGVWRPTLDLPFDGLGTGQPLCQLSNPSSLALLNISNFWTLHHHSLLWLVSEMKPEVLGNHVRFT